MYIHTVLSFIFGIEHLPSQKALLLLSLDEHGTFLCSHGSVVSLADDLPDGSMREMTGEEDDYSSVPVFK